MDGIRRCIRGWGCSVSTGYTDFKTPEGRIWRIGGGLVYGADAEVAAWVSDRLGGGPVKKLFVAIGALRPGTDPKDVTDETLPGLLVGGAYFFDEESGDGYSDIYWSVAVEDEFFQSAGLRDIVRRVLEFPFRMRDLRRISAYIDLANERAVRQAQKLGCVLEGRKRAMAPNGGDVGLFGLLRDECPFWKDTA